MRKNRLSSRIARKEAGPAKFNRRQVLKTSLAVGTAIMLSGKGASMAFGLAPPQPTLIDPTANNYQYFKAVAFKNPLPVPPVLDGRGFKGVFPINIQKNQQLMGLVDPANLKTPLKTTIFGYNGITPGPTFVCGSNNSIQVSWINNLPASHILDPIDHTTIMSAYEPGKGVPVVTHVHGQHSFSRFDGTPDEWYKPSGAHGPYYPGTNTFLYDNTQEGGICWYHDHAMGVTRQNVYAGMAGMFVIVDANDDYLVSANILPARQYEFPLVMQDRMFDTNGQMWYPNNDGTNPFPSVIPEVFGDFMTVNGMVWPYQEVEPRPYRFRLLNACDSRFLHLALSDNSVPFDQIGTETTLLNSPVDIRTMVLPQLKGLDPPMSLTGLLLAPGERADVVIDFSKCQGQTITLRNDANGPMPGGDPVDPVTIGQVVQFRVTKKLNTKIPRSVLGRSLRPISGPIPVYDARKAVRTRKLLLYETIDQYGRVNPFLGTIENGAMGYHEGPITETPGVGELEIWEIYNTTPDLHPIHIHLVPHQVLGRFPFDATIDAKGKLTKVVVHESTNLGREPNENGWKDITHMWPGDNPNPELDPSAYPLPISGQMTRLAIRFDKPDLYVWHCHILSHEEHDMMRPIFVHAPGHPVPTWPPAM